MKAQEAVVLRIKSLCKEKKSEDIATGLFCGYARIDPEKCYERSQQKHWNCDYQNHM